MDFWQRFQKQFSDFWKEVNPSTKALVIVFLSVLLISVVVAVVMNRKPHFDLLYSRLNEATAAEMVRIMDDNNVPYELKNGGRDIYVEKSMGSRVRLLLKNKGLPKEGEGVGFEVFDRPNLGVTDFVQNVQHNRALAGELERTISKIKGIEGVRVHIVLPEEKLFEKDRVEATATVMLHLNFEGSLDPSQVKGIQQLTASSVEGLKPKNITVVDNFGNVLSEPSDEEGDLGMMTTRMGVQKNVESYYIKKVQSLLDQVLGKNNSVVRVDALLDLDKIEETEEKFDPESAVVRSEVITSEKSSGATNTSKGPPGVQSNLTPGSKESGAPSQENASNREVINNKYEIDKKVRHIMKSVGDVKKLTVSVFLKQKVKLDKEGKPALDDKGNPTPEARSADEMNTFMEIVKNAIGVDEKRGDKVVIKEVAFDKKKDEAMEAVETKSPMDVNALIGTLLKVLFSSLALVLFWMLLKRRGGGEAAGGGNQGGAIFEGNPAGGGAMTMGGAADQALQAVDRGTFIEAEVSKAVENYSGEAKRVLKNWLKE